MITSLLMLFGVVLLVNIVIRMFIEHLYTRPRVKELVHHAVVAGVRKFTEENPIPEGETHRRIELHVNITDPRGRF
jgi:hypothetical protein